MVWSLGKQVPPCFGNFEEAPADWRRRARPHEWLDKRWKQFVAGPFFGDNFYANSPHLPNDSGVYFLWDKEWGLLYVGQSIGVKYRVTQHLWARKMPVAYVTMIDAEPDIAPLIENVYIHALEPPCNRLFDLPVWSGHDRMARLVRRVWRQALRSPSTVGGETQSDGVQGGTAK